MWFSWRLWSHIAFLRDVYFFFGFGFRVCFTSTEFINVSVKNNWSRDRMQKSRRFHFKWNIPFFSVCFVDCMKITSICILPKFLYRFCLVELSKYPWNTIHWFIALPNGALNRLFFFSSSRTRCTQSNFFFFCRLNFVWNICTTLANLSSCVWRQ